MISLASGSGSSSAATLSAPLRLMEILGNAVVGGMESYVTRFVRALPREGCEIICLCPYESSVTAELRASGCRVFIAPISDDPRWSTIQLAATLVKKHNIQVMHTHLSNAHVLGAIVGCITDVPCVATIHGRTMPIMDLEICRACRTDITVVSDGAYWHALSLGVPPDQLHYIRNGVDVDLYIDQRGESQWRRQFGISSQQPLIGQVGRLAPEKAPDVFIRMAWLVNQRLRDARFVLVGDGPMRNDLVRMVKELGLEQVVMFAGVQSHMRDVYPALDLLVSASHSEGMPFALMEGMSCGVPVIATNVGGVAELVVSEKTGLLVAPGDHEALARNVIDLLADRERRRAMGAAGRRTVIDNFSFEASSATMAELLMAVAGRAQGASTSLGESPGAKLRAGSPEPTPFRQK